MTVIETDPPRPLWSDRMMIAAADLVAEQLYQDAGLARLRAHMLGWGVVAGFEAMIEGETLVIAPGYGMTAQGREVYLAQHVTLADLSSLVVAACRPGGTADCDDLVATHVPPPAAPLRAWVVARVAQVEGCPRPTLPEGCAHPGQVWQMSRQAGAITIGIACAVDPAYLAAPADCAAMRALRDGAPVPMPALLEDMLVLAEVERDTAGGPSTVTTATRRLLLPVAVLQDMLACCDCLGDEVPDPEPEPEPEPGPEPGPDGRDESVWDYPAKWTLADLIDDLAGFFPRGAGDLALPLWEVFRDGPAMAHLPHAQRLLLRSFAAAAVVSTTADFASWDGGQYLSVMATAANRLRGGRGVALSGSAIAAGLAGAGPDPLNVSLGDLAAMTPNIPDLRSSRGGLTVRLLLSYSPARVRDERALIGAGPAAMLAWMHGRLSEMQAP